MLGPIEISDEIEGFERLGFRNKTKYQPAMQIYWVIKVQRKVMICS